MKRILIPMTLLFASHAMADNGLKTQVRFVLPSDINTIHQAANYFIEPHGYKIQFAGTAPAQARMIAVRNINVNQPNGEIMNVETALLKLLNDDEILIIDTNNKLVSFGKTDMGVVE